MSKDQTGLLVGFGLGLLVIGAAIRAYQAGQLSPQERIRRDVQRGTRKLVRRYVREGRLLVMLPMGEA